MTRGNNVGSAFRRPLGVKSAIQTLVIIITIKCETVCLQVAFNYDNEYDK